MPNCFRAWQKKDKTQIILLCTDVWDKYKTGNIVPVFCISINCLITECLFHRWCKPSLEKHQKPQPWVDYLLGLGLPCCCPAGWSQGFPLLRDSWAYRIKNTNFSIPVLSWKKIHLRCITHLVTMESEKHSNSDITIGKMSRCLECLLWRTQSKEKEILIFFWMNHRVNSQCVCE